MSACSRGVGARVLAGEGVPAGDASSDTTSAPSAARTAAAAAAAALVGRALFLPATGVAPPSAGIALGGRPLFLPVPFPREERGAAAADGTGLRCALLPGCSGAAACASLVAIFDEGLTWSTSIGSAAGLASCAPLQPHMPASLASIGCGGGGVERGGGGKGVNLEIPNAPLRGEGLRAWASLATARDLTGAAWRFTGKLMASIESLSGEVRALGAIVPDRGWILFRILGFPRQKSFP